MNAALTRLVWKRAKSCCEYCQMPQAADDAIFQIDHIVARKHVGPTVASNLCLSCFIVTRSKDRISPVEIRRHVRLRRCSIPAGTNGPSISNGEVPTWSA